MSAAIVIALYKPRKGQQDALDALVRGHEPALREAGLVTDRPFVRMRSEADGTILEIFEWTSSEAAQAAHAHETVGPLWEAMGEVATFVVPAELQESTRTFPHFQPLP